MAKAKTKKSFHVEFYANMNWFDVAEQPAKPQDLPDAFIQAKKLSKSKSSKNQEAILALLSPYVRARFLPENLTHSDSLFSPENGAEVEATDVRLVAVDFSSSPIPKCKAEAHFNLRLLVDPGTCDFDAWQEENSNFYDAVAFYWEIERNEQTEDLDFTFGDHQGVECIAAVHPHAPAADATPAPSPLSQLNFVGLSAANRKKLIDFLANSWSDEVKNLTALQEGSGETLTIEIAEDDKFLLGIAIKMMDFEKYVRED